MFTAARVRDPETQKAGTPMPTSHNFVHNSEIEDSPTYRLAQYPVLVPRIIATHWLRPEPMEAANG